jgi:ABC-2 type transport system permease protein
MSAIAVAARPGRVATDQPPSITRLTKIELRKMSDTRAGLWLEIGVLAAMVLTVIITCLAGHPDQLTFHHILSNALFPAAILLPIVGTLLITSEWSQRTTLTTFGLVPRRSRVLAAKVLAAAAVSVVPFAFALAISAAGTAASASGVQGVWTLDAATLAQSFLYLVTNMMIGVAFGAALLASAPAIVAYFVLPTAVSALHSAIGEHSFLAWIDSSTTFPPMTEHALSATQWGRLGTTWVVWLLLPLAIGAWRVLRSEIK